MAKAGSALPHPGSDLQGREYAKLVAVRMGDTLLCDRGFSCIEENTERVVQQDEDGDLYIKCKHGKHFLEGQLGPHGELVGLYAVEKQQQPKEKAKAKPKRM